MLLLLLCAWLALLLLPPLLLLLLQPLLCMRLALTLPLFLLPLLLLLPPLLLLHAPAWAALSFMLTGCQLFLFVVLLTAGVCQQLVPLVGEEVWVNVALGLTREAASTS